MKAIVCREFGPLEQLDYAQIPDPIAGPAELLVDVRAASVNYLDGLIVQGQYQVKPERPFVPGAEIAGRVSAVGAGVSGFAIGDRVMGASVLGGFAEKIAINASSVVRIPDFLPDEEAAGLMIGHGTAHHALKQRARLQPGEHLLVTGAAGGTGLAAVQIGKAIGARVTAICSSAEKLAIAKANGADALIDSHGDIRAQLKEAAGARGIDVVYDTVGGDLFDALTRTMAWNGRLLVIGFASGRIPQFPVNLALVKGYSIVGVYWGSFVKQDPGEAAANAVELLQWYEQGRVHVAIDSTLPLSRAMEGISRLTNRQATGKVILKP